jgi:hypothetical protein
MARMQEHMAVSFGWKLPDEPRVKVTFDTRVVAYEEAKDRWLVVLEPLDPAASASLPGNLPNDAAALIRALAGKWAYVPQAAREGVTLPLKFETLTRNGWYFYDADPRTPSNVIRHESTDE